MVNLEGSKWSAFMAILLVVLTSLQNYSESIRITSKTGTKSTVFHSPAFELEPGSVQNRFYYDIEFPKGHIAFRGFDAEVVDEAGNSVPLHETYLHHWYIMRYHARRGVATSSSHNSSDFRIVPNSGVCQGNSLPQYYGLGSETRKTPTLVPDPYGVEIGNPAEIPEGFEERWFLNVHTIDTRGAVDRLGCTECWCDLYNVTVDEDGQALSPGYFGGLSCCYDRTRCKVREDFWGAKRRLFLRYTVHWVEWSDSVLPTWIYFFDATDSWNPVDGEHDCQVEYQIAQSCGPTGPTSQSCVDTRSSRARIPNGGYLVYGVGHQHTGGIGSALYGEDGRVICSSMPIYGEGHEAGNESGYIVGMSTCYPKPGSVKILGGETLRMESNYSSHRAHTGVMGLFQVLLADRLPNPTSSQA